MTANVLDNTANYYVPNFELSDDDLYFVEEPSFGQTYSGDESDLFAAIARGRAGERFYTFDEFKTRMRAAIDGVL